MKVLITTGTTPFKSLVNIAISNFQSSHHIYVIQSPCLNNYTVLNGNIETHTFIENIEEHYQSADLVITHAGAGSVYRLLELQKKVVVVPNVDRIDNHQLDLAAFIEKNNYAKVIYDVNMLSDKLINDALNEQYNTFTKDNFFLIDEIFGEIL
ncbi:glycosyltransferase [Cobetia sp. MMG027]|uniref:PssE/Cps14G family polysaccharide biosynthesis glycosyltransferase n=1 Tax=Cobetia sp. MMG027 TaxID=3021980 RepID=UPI0022FE26C4|nr:PssE/Cps14G family polysaccharide biosynthesis glycosyltransferase [Cobetia sp. MMG027]MDA5565372.1 glycosyltransferase [Cobetia sp. MMG027]